MGFLDKVMFWKKKESEDLGTGLDFGQQNLNPNMGMGSGNMGMPDYGMPDYSQPQRYPAQHTFDDSQYGINPQVSIRELPRQEPFAPQNYTAEKNMEIISSKLDALRAGIESINQRLMALERIAQADQEQQLQKRRQLGW